MYELSQLSNDYIEPSCQKWSKIELWNQCQRLPQDFFQHAMTSADLHRLLEDPRLVVLPFGLFIYILQYKYIYVCVPCLIGFPL
jgi:hypothetical protein